MNNHTLDSVVREYLIRKGDSSMSSYAKCLSLAIAAIRNLSMVVHGNSKVAALDILPNGTVRLPEDYMDLKKIGVAVGANVCELTSSVSMNLNLGVDDCGNETANPGAPTTSIITNIGEPHSRNGEFTGRFFGGGGARNEIGYYRVDLPNRRIILSLGSETETSVVLEYISDPSLLDESFVIHPYDVEAVIAWITWKDIQYKRNVSMSEKESARFDWKRCKMEAQRLHKSFTLRDAYEAIRKYQSQAPRL